MRIAEINSCNFGSTGKIMLEIANVAERYGHTAVVCYPKSRTNLNKQKETDIVIGSRFSRNLHLKFAYYTGLNGCFSSFSTLHFLRRLDKFKPDIIHLHNLHNSYIHLPLLFNYIKKHNIKTVWTLHDCWSFTGQCPYFTMVKCDKWKTGCHDCPSYREYPQSKVELTKTMWKLKKKWFTGVKNMTIVTPSQWLADLVKESYLKDYPVQVLNNGIDLSIFKPTESNFRSKHGIGDKKMLLGVAFGWGTRKGLDVFIKLAKKLDKDKIQIVLVGTDETTDKMLPENIISIHRTQNQKELAEIYTAADIFVNPTREENYPTVNMEALACGTPVITFKTGGSPEIIDETCGSVVSCDDIDALETEIINFMEKSPLLAENCCKHAEQFDMRNKFAEYVKLYETIMKSDSVKD